jgi:hypothetical protein
VARFGLAETPPHEFLEPMRAVAQSLNADSDIHKRLVNIVGNMQAVLPAYQLIDTALAGVSEPVALETFVTRQRTHLQETLTVLGNEYVRLLVCAPCGCSDFVCFFLPCTRWLFRTHTEIDALESKLHFGTMVPTQYQGSVVQKLLATVALVMGSGARDLLQRTLHAYASLLDTVTGSTPLGDPLAVGRPSAVPVRCAPPLIEPRAHHSRCSRCLR